MTETPSVIAAIVPTYNRKEMLAECLRSLLDQSRRPDLVLVVDDGSEDGTEAMVAARFAGEVCYLRQSNGGKASALNHALQALGGRFDLAWFCDDDDLAAPGACEALVQALERAPEADFAYGRYQLLYRRPGGQDRLVTPFGWPSKAQPDIFLALMERMFIQQFSSMVRRSVLETMGPFRVELVRSQDYEMLLRLAYRRRGAAVDQVLFYQRQHDGVRGSSRTFLEPWRERLGVEGFTPAFAQALNGALRRRAGLLQSAVIFGRRGLWDLAAADWVAAAALGDDQPPSLDEGELATGLSAEADALWVLGREPELARLIGGVRRNEFGRSLLRHLRRPLLWHLRHELFAGRTRSSLLAARLVAWLRP